MKQRVTVLQPSGTSIDPDVIRLTRESVDFAGVRNATIERRVTASLSELPDELRRLSLWQHTHELHIRWNPPNAPSSPPAPPLVARLPAGLHVFFTPNGQNGSFNICPFLTSFFGSDLKCHSTATTFSRPPVLSERFAHTATFQYFSPLPQILRFQAALSAIYCKGPEDPLEELHAQSSNNGCLQLIAALSFADSVYVDFDTISGSVTITGIWPSKRAPANVMQASRTWSSSGDSLELGFLAAQRADEAEEIKLGGVLAVVGTDERPAPTVFSFPSRHHILPSSAPLTFHASFRHPTGLHPSLDIIMPRSHLAPPKTGGSCALHAYLTLPSALFLDKYQLEDNAFLATHNLRAVRSLSGEQDLEAPDWVVNTWGSAALLELALPNNADGDETDNYTATIPTHLRYLPNTLAHSGKDHASILLPWPVLFWACGAEEGLKMSTNPFDSVNLGYDGLFGPKTMFYHIPPAISAQSLLLEMMVVPTLNKAWAGTVQWGTLVAGLTGFLWVCWALFIAVRVSNGRTAMRQSSMKHKK